ncbi:MAG TPA: cupredoxin domain-containing protein, partial [Longimicrobiales bacterium]|nr:cupredoxin domain-containing protein [Longimicrobiales bacterium]
MNRSRVGYGRHAWAVAMALLVAVAGCSDDDDDNGTGPGTNEVTVRDQEFVPADLTVTPGATVTWTWDGQTAEPHNVTFDDPGITDSGNQSSGTFQATMPQTPGTYDYHCTFHVN